jgi:Uma2 family endonuclease
MGLALRKAEFTGDDYLAWEASQSQRHEYVRGEVFAMAGGEDRHASATGNVYSLLRQHLRGSRCRVYMNDVKLQVDAANCFFYPDVFVTCSSRDLAERLVKRDAVLVAEVLSPSTAAYDRGDKFAAYRQLPSLQELLLLDLDRRTVELFRRQPGTAGAGPHDPWVLHPLTEGDDLQLQSVGCTLAVADVLADLEGQADAPAPANA